MTPVLPDNEHPAIRQDADADRPWWVGSVGYEIYPRSFADSNGDGVGDLLGIRDRLDHLAWLGVDAVWIAPFSASPGHDHGYDVSDYLAVNPIHGTIADFESLTERARSLGLRVLVDLVPNHTSIDHEWFRSARRGRNDPLRGCYVWRDPAPDGGPPNNWVSHFGGPAWTLDEASGQYYCHLFLPEQPDLNWESELVRAGFDEILRFWCELGVDGFRIDVAHALVKDQSFADNPLRRELTDADGPLETFDAYDHLHDLHQPATIDIYRRWRRVVEPYGAMLLGEVGSASPAQLARFVETGDALHSAFYLEPVWADWEPAWLLAQSRAVADRAPHGISWVINNHDRSRSVSRYGGGARGARRSMAATTFQFCLGGMPFLYQGEELGIGDGEIASSDLSDPVATRNEGATGRDGCRTAMPWHDGPGNGFTTASSAWLRARDRAPEHTVAGQRSDPSAVVHRYRALIATRRALPDLWSAPLVWRDDLVPAERSGEVSVIERGSTLTIANLSADSVETSLPSGSWQVAFASWDGAPDGPIEHQCSLPAEMTAILSQ